MNRFENRLNRDNTYFRTLRPVWDYDKETALNVFEMIDELNNLQKQFDIVAILKAKFQNRNHELEKENHHLHKENIKLRTILHDLGILFEGGDE